MNASFQRSPAHASGLAREPARLLFDRICNNAGAISRSRIVPAERVSELLHSNVQRVRQRYLVLAAIYGYGPLGSLNHRAANFLRSYNHCIRS